MWYVIPTNLVCVLFSTVIPTSPFNFNCFLYLLPFFFYQWYCILSYDMKRGMYINYSTTHLIASHHRDIIITLPRIFFISEWRLESIIIIVSIWLFKYCWYDSWMVMQWLALMVAREKCVHVLYININIRNLMVHNRYIHDTPISNKG